MPTKWRSKLRFRNPRWFIGTQEGLQRLVAQSRAWGEKGSPVNLFQIYGPQFVDEHHAYDERMRSTDRLFGGIMGPSEDGWTYGGGSSFYIDDHDEIQYHDVFAIQRIGTARLIGDDSSCRFSTTDAMIAAMGEGSLDLSFMAADLRWIVTMLHDQPVHQEFTTLDAALDVVWDAYGLATGLEFIRQAINEMGFMAEIQDEGKTLVATTGLLPNAPDSQEYRAALHKDGNHYILDEPTRRIHHSVVASFATAFSVLHSFDHYVEERDKRDKQPA